MTQKAQEILELCRHALKRYDTDPPSGPDWILYWVAVVALLRTVGYALAKIDAKSSRELETAIKSAWEDWKANKEGHDIFFYFIDQERSNIIHQFELASGQGVTVHIGGGPHTYDDPFKGDDRFYGRTQQDMIAEAIEWWEERLAEIELEVMGL